MRFHSPPNVHISMPRAALTAVFDQCDGFDRDETGGRLIGTFTEHRGSLKLSVTGIIESGPNAKRSNTSFFQDGEYQERVFRKVESAHPETEHLGNWHTHHVNGYPTLSSGDVSTYQRTVNHPKHNTPFFYALLVTEKQKGRNPLERYHVKHYLFRRGDEHAYELTAKSIEITDAPLLWPRAEEGLSVEREDTKRAIASENVAARPERANDSEFIKEFYSDLRVFSSPKLGVYWRGSIELSDGSNLQVVVVEDSSGPSLGYSIALPQAPKPLLALAESLGATTFPSARAALIQTERFSNSALLQWHIGPDSKLLRKG
jgi:integrative and conjugative element protein (TIGR02256 family)